MATASIYLPQTSYDGSVNLTPFRIDFSESITGLVLSSLQNLNGDLSVPQYTHGGGANWYFGFTHNASSGVAGYFRFTLAADAVTPNLNNDEDWTIYWGTDNVLHTGNTDGVRASRLTSSLSNIRWTQSSATAGSTQGIQFDFSVSVNNFAAPDLTIGGDITSVSNFRRDGLDHSLYYADVAVPADLTGGGSFTLQIQDLESIYPGLDESEEWTLSWNENGNLSAIRTSDIPAVLTASLSADTVPAGGIFTLYMQFDKTVTLTYFGDLVLTDGTSITAATTLDSELFYVFLTAPATGNGQGVITMPENMVPEGNNGVVITFDYIEQVNPELSLSAASIENSGTIIAQVDFDYDISNFTRDNIVLDLPNPVIGIGDHVLGIGNKVLGLHSAVGASVGEPISLGDNNRTWAVPITVPATGEGEVGVRVPEDTFGFRSEERRVTVRYAAQNAPSITLNIQVRDDLTLLPFFGQDFEHIINISGNNIRSVDVIGLLRPFYHHWDPTTGSLYIRGRPESFYEKLGFTITAVDQDGSASKKANITVIDRAPVIVVPANPIRLRKGAQNNHNIQIKNFPLETTVEGTWSGLDHEHSRTGVNIIGTIPADVNFGVNSGIFKITANNKGGQDTADVPWESGEILKWDFSSVNDLWLDDSFISNTGLHVGDSINLNFAALVSRTNPSDPISFTVTFRSASVPRPLDGLFWRDGILSGTIMERAGIPSGRLAEIEITILAVDAFGQAHSPLIYCTHWNNRRTIPVTHTLSMPHHRSP